MKYSSDISDWENLKEEVEEPFLRPFDVTIKKEPTNKLCPQQVSLQWVQQKLLVKNISPITFMIITS